MRKIVEPGKFQYRPSLVRYTIAALGRVGVVSLFWFLVWMFFGGFEPPFLVFISLATIVAVFFLSFIEPFLMFIEVEFGRIEGPDGFGSSAITLDEVLWSHSWHTSVGLNIQTADGRAVTADRAHFAAEELEEMFLIFIGGNTNKPAEDAGSSMYVPMGLASDC